MAQADVGGTEAPAESSAQPQPYLRYRDMTLGYHGASEDQVDVTEYRIGWFGPTDADDPLTGDLWWATDFAVSEANRSRLNPSFAPPLVPRPSSPLPFRLVPRWSTDVWGTGVSQLARMVYEEEPLAVIGSIDSSATHLAEQVVAKANLPLVSPIATDKTATLAGVAWMFSCAPADTAVARVMVEAALEAADRRTRPSGNHPTDTVEASGVTGVPRVEGSILLLGTTDHDSRMTAREVMAEFSRRGRLPDLRVDLPAGAADVRAQLGAATARNPAVVIIIAAAEDAARLVRTTRELLGDVDILGGPSMGRHRFVALAGLSAEGVRFPLLFSAHGGARHTVAFVEQFTSQRGRPPDYTAALAYDATRMLLEAIDRAGPNRARIREVLLQLSPWPGVSGAIQFDGTGQNVRADLRLGTVQHGVVVPVASDASTSTPNPALAP